MFDFSKKRFLITQPMMHWLAGSTIVTIELAEYLKKAGADVTIYTCFYDDPVRNICIKKGLHVDKADELPEYRLDDFDYIWVHSQVLPLSIVDALYSDLPKKMPAFVFLHMSGLDWIPDERPWIYKLEEKLNSRVLAICERTGEIMIPFFSKTPSLEYYRNPAPMEFLHRTRPVNNQCKKVLIVSNHPPIEVEKAGEKLRECGVEVVFLGEHQDDYTLVDINLLSRFDAVITIGKTVQYCLVSGTPVYIYDWFGGPGYLNAQNSGESKRRNYSGRGFEKKTAEIIADEIINKYNTAIKYQQRNINKFINDFSIEKVLSNIFETLKPRKDIKKISTDYYKMLRSSELLAERRFMDASWVRIRADEAAHVPKLEEENETLRAHLVAAEEKLNTKSYKAYSRLLRPYTAVRNKLKK